MTNSNRMEGTTNNAARLLEERKWLGRGGMVAFAGASLFGVLALVGGGGSSAPIAHPNPIDSTPLSTPSRVPSDARIESRQMLEVTESPRKFPGRMLRAQWSKLKELEELKLGAGKSR